MDEHLQLSIEGLRYQRLISRMGIPEHLLRYIPLTNAAEEKVLDEMFTETIERIKARIFADVRIIIPKAAFLPPTHRLGSERSNARRRVRRMLYRSRKYQNMSLGSKVRVMRTAMDTRVPGH